MKFDKQTIEPFEQQDYVEPPKAAQSIAPLIIASSICWVFIVVWVIDIMLNGQLSDLINVAKLLAPGVGILMLMKLWKF